MIDTLTLWLDTKEAEKAVSRLTGQMETINRHTGETTLKGQLGSLRVKITGQGISVNGSLPRFFYGNNAMSLKRDTTKQAIEKMSDELHLPMNQAKVSRLDIAENIMIEKPVIAYLPQFVSAPYLNKDSYCNGEGVLFKNRQKALAFYDKPKEISDKHKTI